VVALRAALPWAAARGVERWAAGELGIPVEVAAVELALLRGEAALRGVVAGPRPAPGAPIERETAFLAARRLEARLDWGTLLRERRVDLREFEVEAPLLRLERRADGSVALRGTGASAEPAEGEERPEAGEEPPADAAPAGDTGTAGEGEEAVAGDGGTPVRVERARIADGALHLVEAEDGAPLLELSLEALDLRQLVVGTTPLRLGSLSIEQPALRVERALLRGAPAPPPQAERPPEAEPDPAPPQPDPGYRLGRLRIERASVVLGGTEEAAPLEVALDLEVRELGASPDGSFPVTLRIDAGGGFLEAEGEAGLAPPAFAGSVAWRELRLATLLAAGAPAPAAWVRSGRSSGALRLDGRSDAGPEASGADEERPDLRVEGEVSVADLDLQDPAGSGVGLGAGELVLRIGGGEASFGAGEDASGTPALHAGSLELDGAELRFSDLRVAPAYRLRLPSLEARARELAWAGPSAREIGVEVRADPGSELRLEGELVEGVGWLEGSLRELGLPPLAPYTEAAVGLRFHAGSLGVEGRAELETGRTRVDSTWRVGDPRLAGGDPGIFERTVGVSRGMALALLRGPGGDIQLPVSFVVERGELATDTGAILRGALRQALVGVLTTPLKALGAVLPTGGGAEPARTVAAPLPAEPGRVRLTGEGESRLAALAALLAEHPDLAAVLRGRVDPGELDAPAAEGEAEAGDEPARGVSSPRTPLALAQARSIRARSRLFEEEGVDLGRVAVASPAPPGEPGVVVELIPLVAPE